MGGGRGEGRKKKTNRKKGPTRVVRGERFGQQRLHLVGKRDSSISLGGRINVAKEGGGGGVGGPLLTLGGRGTAVKSRD